MVDDIVDGLVDPAIDLHGDALTKPLAIGLPAVETGHGRQASFDGPQDLPHRIFFRRPAEPVAALGAPGSPEQSASGQGRHDLLQIFHGYVLALGHGFERNAAIIGMQRDVQHEPEGITPPGGQLHITPSIFLCCLQYTTKSLGESRKKYDLPFSD